MSKCGMEIAASPMYIVFLGSVICGDFISQGGLVMVTGSFSVSYKSGYYSSSAIKLR